MPVERVDELLAAFDALPERHGLPWDAEAAYRWVWPASPALSGGENLAAPHEIAFASGPSTQKERTPNMWGPGRNLEAMGVPARQFEREGGHCAVMLHARCRGGTWALWCGCRPRRQERPWRKVVRVLRGEPREVVPPG
jgi:hypothetical protein